MFLPVARQFYTPATTINNRFGIFPLARAIIRFKTFDFQK